jgi:signal transduction histidine kinase/ActR/RegA family two-component response regulator
MITKRHYFKTLFAWIFILFCLNANAYDKKDVLLLCSYHPSFPSFYNQVNGVKSVFTNKNISLDVEYMDSKRYIGKENKEFFHQRLSYKLKNKKPYDAIIVADDNALNYILEYQESHYKNIPIVFFGLNNLENALKQNNNRHVTGLVEFVSMEETLTMIKKMFPKSKKLYIIHDSTETGKGLLKVFQTFYSVLKNVKVEEFNLSKLSYNELGTKLRNIDKIHPVLLLSGYLDKNKTPASFDQVLNLLKANLDSPVFHLWYHGMGKGVMGGKLITHYEQSKLAAEIVCDIFDGKNVAEIPVSSESPNVYVFDYNELLKHKISPDILPEESELINEPQGFYSKYKQVIIISLVVLAVLTFFVLFLASNIIKRVKIEKELKKAKLIAENSDSVKTEFIKNISREIKEPLNNLIEYSDLFKEEVSINKEKPAHLKKIKENSNQLIKIIENVLEYSENEESAVEKKIQVANINQIIDDLYSEFEIKAKTKGISIHKYKDLTSNISNIHINGNALVIAMYKLINNAMKHTAKGEISFGYKLKNDSISFYVTDTGSLIPEEKCIEISKAFRKQQGYISRTIDGIGLNLTIVKKNIDLLNGTVEISSNRDTGTSFSFNVEYIPFSNKSKLKENEKSEYKFTPSSILITEDEEINYQLLKAGFESLDDSIEIYHARNGKEAVDFIKRENKVDLVLMDLKMPIMTGFEATVEIKKLDEKLPIVAQTAYTTVEDIERAFNAGCCDYLTKPIQKNKLKEIILKYLMDKHN